MQARTTVQLPRPILKRLRAHVRAGETYADTLSRLLDLDDRQRYVERAFETARDKKRLLPFSALK